MLRIIKESFNITNNNLNLATPLIIFSLLSSLYLIFSASNNVGAMVFTIILLILMLSSFLSGWFYMVTQTIKNYDNNTQTVSLADFATGVGEYFLNVLCMLLNMIFLFLIISIVSFVIGKHFIGHLGITSIQLVNALSSVETTKQFVLSLTDEQILKLNLWNTLIFVDSIIYYLLILFYATTLFFKQKNPYFAFVISIKDLFCKHLLKNIGLLVFIFAVYMLISMLSAIFATNNIMHFILTLVNFYYITFSVILIFNYYYSYYIKIGSVIDTKA